MSMGEISIRNGELEIYSSGSFFLDKKSSSVLFTILNAHLQLIFTENKDLDKAETLIKGVSDTVIITCVNWRDRTVRGLEEPVEIMRVGDDSIFLKFMILDMASMPVLFYTFYRKRS